MVLCYLNNYNTIKFKEKFGELYKISKNILFDVMLKYKFYFKKKLELDINFLNELIKFATSKDFKEFKENALFYLNDIDSCVEVRDNNK